MVVRQIDAATARLERINVTCLSFISNGRFTFSVAARPASVHRRTLGKLPGLDEQVQASWDSIDDLLEGHAPGRQVDLGGKPPAPAVHGIVASGCGARIWQPCYCNKLFWGKVSESACPTLKARVGFQPTRMQLGVWYDVAGSLGIRGLLILESWQTAISSSAARHMPIPDYVPSILHYLEAGVGIRRFCAQLRSRIAFLAIVRKE